MTNVREITNFLDRKLDTAIISDNSVNGLQVEKTGKVLKVGVAVDACLDIFRKAKQENCDMVLVHHGLFWGPDTITDQQYARVKFLLENNIAVYACHLPLDKHKEYGNNALLFRMLGCNIISEFGEVGFQGEFAKEKHIEDIIKQLEQALGTAGTMYLHGKKMVKTIGIVSGRSHRLVLEAKKQDLDLFITGEAVHGLGLLAKDACINVICPGHYNTETLGVKAAGQLIKENFGIPFVFLDNPTGL